MHPLKIDYKDVHKIASYSNVTFRDIVMFIIERRGFTRSFIHDLLWCYPLRANYISLKYEIFDSSGSTHVNSNNRALSVSVTWEMDLYHLDSSRFYISVLARSKPRIRTGLHRFIDGPFVFPIVKTLGLPRGKRNRMRQRPGILRAPVHSDSAVYRGRAIEYILCLSDSTIEVIDPVCKI